MIKTVIGSFDNAAVSMQVAADLVAAGFMQTDLTELSRVATTPAEVIDALTGMGVEEPVALHYAEFIRRGGALVTVKVDLSREEEAEYLMRRHGAIDIEERVEQWKGTGWSGYDADAGPYSFEQIEQERERYAGRSQQQRIYPPA